MVSTASVTADTIQLWGGALCLDFANSVDWSAQDEPLSPSTDALTEPGALIRWARRCDLIAPGIEPAVDDAELLAAKILRSALHKTFATIAAGHVPDGPALAHIMRDYSEAAAAAHIAARNNLWQLAWEPTDTRGIRFAIVADAVALLADPARLPRLRQCPGNNCGWFFLDTSGRRRWCSMQTCGSRAKMRRHYQRHRSSSLPTRPAEESP
jgi:predicted RNA-binding Zn ribbon-like protein